jgi:hypothetical protein
VGRQEELKGTENSLSLPYMTSACNDDTSSVCAEKMSTICDDNVRCNLLTDFSTPATEKPSVGSGQGIGNHTGITQLTGSPLRQSVRLLESISADGMFASDEYTMQKSMKQTAWKNLDGAIEQEKAATRSPSMIPSMSLKPHCLDSIPGDRCISSLNKLGV